MEIKMSEHNVGIERLRKIEADHPSGHWYIDTHSCWYCVKISVDGNVLDITYFGTNEAKMCKQIEQAAALIAAQSDDEPEDEEE